MENIKSSLLSFVLIVLCSSIYANTMGPWNLDSLYTVPKWETIDVAAKDGLTGILYRSLQYKGNPVQVFAYYSAPDGDMPDGGWPAVVYSHGGGGSASDAWVNAWNAKGYACISMDLEGHYSITDDEDNRIATPYPGPKRTGVWDDYELPIEEQWFYHAVAQIIRAHTLMASFPEVNADKIGMIGPSWGGTLTSTVMGVDARLKFAIPIYGAGYLSESDGHQGMAFISEEQAAFVNSNYDGSAYFSNVTYPTLWINGTNDYHFALTCNQKSSRAVQGPATMLYLLRFRHGGNAAIGESEIYAFADHVIKGANALIKLEKPRQYKNSVSVKFSSDVRAESAQLFYTLDDGQWRERYWHDMEALVVGDSIVAEIPDSATTIIFSATDARGLRVSSEYLEVASKLEQNFNYADPVLFTRLPIEALDSSLFKFIPTVEYGDVMQASDSTTFTTEYQPSDSYWAAHCNEEDVYLARLKHSAGIDDSWDLRIGKGGQIYSFIGAYGEGVPPSNDEKSRWNDEVWQPVSVCTDLNNGDAFTGVKSMKYYIHGAGNYINEESQTNTFYSPLMASWYDEGEKAYYVNNWGQQAHVPSLYKSGILYTTKYKDIGEGVLEVTYVVQNFGDDIQNHLNVPWGGVRSSNLRGQFLSMPDQSIKVNTMQTGTTGSGNYDVDETGGFFIFANDTVTPTSPSMGIVFGDEIRKDELSDHNLSNIYFRHAQVGGDTNPRDYSLFVVIPKLEVKPGETFYYRMYYVNGNRDFVHEKSKELVPFVDYGFIDAPTNETAMVTIKTADIDNGLTQDINLFGSPVKDNIPLFLMENTATGKQYVSSDLYHNVTTEAFTNPYVFDDSKYATYQYREVNRPYDGKVKYLKLLGYGVKKVSVSSSEIEYGLLDTMILDAEKVVLTDDYKNQVLVPLTFREGWSESDDEDDGLRLYHNFSDESIVDFFGATAMTYTDSVANPDITAGHTDPFVAKVVRGEAVFANIRYNLPQDIDLSEQSTITLKVYFETIDTVLPDNCSLSMTLRNSTTGATNQFLKLVEIPEMNKWCTLSFDVSGAVAKGPHDQLWLLFSKTDTDLETTGQVFYIDDFRGPAFYIESYTAVTSRTCDSVIIDLSENDVELKELIDPYFKLERVNGGEDIDVTDISYDVHHIYLTLDPNADVTYQDALELSLFSGKIIDVAGKELPWFSEMKVQNGNSITFRVIDAKTQEVLSGVAVTINDTTLSTDVQGELSFKMPTGDFDFTLSKPYYDDYFSTLSIISNVDSTFELDVLQAGIQFTVTDGTLIIEDATVVLNGVTEHANMNGEINYANLDVLSYYDYEVTADGYEPILGDLFLLKDTILAFTLSVSSDVKELSSRSVNIFPNPAIDFFIIESEKQMSKVEILNINGQILVSQEVFGNFVKLNLLVKNQSFVFVNILLNDGSQITNKVMIVSAENNI